MIKYLNKFLIAIIFLLGIGLSNCYATIVTDSSGDLVLDSSNDPVSDSNGPPPVMPSITTQPVNQAVLAPAMATFTVVAGGNPTPTYQWQQEAPGATSYTPISTATSASYTTPATVVANSGTKYECVVSNVLGTVTSNAATLTVNTAPSITTQPVSATVTAPATATFTVVAGGNPAPTYQWQQEAPGSGSFTAISGATSASYTTPATTTANNATQYECVLTNSSGTVTTNAVTLTVGGAPSITTQPASLTLTAPATATFSVTATGTPTPTYSWQSEASGATSYTAISGATSASYTTPATTTANSGTKYECVVTNSIGSVTSSAATLTVTGSPVVSISAPANNSTFATGSNITATAIASETNGSIASISLYYNGTNLIGTGTASPYTVTVSSVGAGTYTLTAKATDAQGVSTTSSTVTITVATAVLPVITTQPASTTLLAPATATFSVVATGTPTPTYQWQSEASGGTSYTAISGATSASYTTPATTTGNSGTKYECVVTNSAGSVTSNAATLTVNPSGEPSITTQPSSVTVTAPATATFTVAATGSPAPTYQWMQEASGAAGYTVISGATSVSYTTPATTMANSGTKYECVATNSVGSVTSTAATLTVNPGLVGWWKFTDGSGTTAADSSGSGNTGTLENAPSWVAGKVWPHALSFNGTNQYVITSKATNIPNINGSATYSAWVKESAAPGTPRDIVDGELSGSSANQLRINASGNAEVSEWGGAIILTAGAVSINAWHMITWTYDGTTNSIYIDGVLSKTSTTAHQSGTPNMVYVGNWGSGEYFNGTIDDVRIYNGALSASAVAQLYASTNSLLPSITTQPSNATVTAPLTATFTVAATGVPTPTYQWMQEASTATSYTAISGATNTSYTTAATTTANSGTKYECVVTNIIGSVTSNAATLTVNPHVAPTVSLTSPVNNASYTAPASVTLTANAAATNATVSKVAFYQGTTLLGTATSSPYTYTWSASSIGSYALTAVVTDSTGATATSSTVNIIINEPAPTVSLTTNDSAYTAPAGIILTAAASQLYGTISRVDFYNGATLLGSASTSPYTYTWSNVAAGNYSLTAHAYNNAGSETTSNTISINVKAPNVYIQSTSYNANGQITQTLYGNGTTTAYTYNPLNFHLMRIYTTNAQAQVIQDLNYTYDSVGQVLAIDDNVNVGTNSMTQSFTYDPLNRLVSATGAYGAKNYAYDSIGNVTQKDGLTYNYGEANSRTNGTTAGPHAVTSLSDGSVFKYDANGNMVSLQKGSNLTQYAYDSQNRLQTVTVGGLTIAAYAYDGDGGRIQKTVNRRDLALYNDNTNALLFGSTANPLPATAQNPVVDTTVYAGSVYETENATGLSRQTKFIYLGSARIALEGSDGSVFFYHTDALGGTNVLTDQTGQVRELTEYDPFGQVTVHEKYGNNFSTAWYYFTGKPLDDETGLIFLAARYYNPSLGRFITPDTVVQAPDNPQTLNRYTYCNNNPINLVDPSGHSWWSKFWKSVAKVFEDIALAIIAIAAVVLQPELAGLIGGFAASVVTGAAVGAAIGGVSSSILGGDMGQGILTGAIGGAIFGGIGSFGLSGPAQIGAHFAGGAASGAIDGVISGGNAGINAIINGLSAGASEWAGEDTQLFKLSGNYITDVVKQAALGGVIGGAASSATGGSFVRGFESGAETSAIAYTANSYVHFNSNLLGIDKANNTMEWGSLWSLDASYDFQESGDDTMNFSWGIKDPYLSFGMTFDSQNGSPVSISVGFGLGSPITVTTSTLGSLYKQPDEIGKEIAQQYQEDECAASMGSDC